MVQTGGLIVTIKRKKLVFVLLAAFLIVLIMHKALPFILLFNSIPGQRHLDDVEQLQTSVDAKRVRAISEMHRQQVLFDFASSNFSELGSTNRNQSMKTLRTVLACFARGEKIEACNDLVRSMYVWGRSGSDWKLNPEGDYDFTATWMIRLLYEFGHKNKIFFPETRDYLVDTLLNLEGKPVLTVPLSIGTVFDTENHILMRESSRYLKNQWMAAHGNESNRYNNKKNGMETWIERYLNSIRIDGVYEYNSMPYVTYAILPLTFPPKTVPIAIGVPA
ncbi:MAG: hypothetical protein FJ263_05815 [Planctomycetes bacterium]|nr:hypothetical protein [Planctomycetota bacterium]